MRRNAEDGTCVPFGGTAQLLQVSCPIMIMTSTKWNRIDVEYGWVQMYLNIYGLHSLIAFHFVFFLQTHGVSEDVWRARTITMNAIWIRLHLVRRRWKQRIHIEMMAFRQQQKRQQQLRCRGDCNCFCLYIRPNRRLFHRKIPTLTDIRPCVYIFNYAPIEYFCSLSAAVPALHRCGSRMFPTHTHTHTHTKKYFQFL